MFRIFLQILYNDMQRALFIVLLFLSAVSLPAQRRLQTVTAPDTTVRPDTMAQLPAPPVPPPRRSVLTDSVVLGLKCNPALLLSGELPLFAEWRINRTFSIEAAAGFTYVDLLYESVMNGGYFLGNKNVKFRSGSCFRLQGRMYPRHSDMAIAGWYAGPELTFRTYKMDWYEFTGLLYDVYPCRRKISEIRLVGGWQNAENSGEPFFDVYLAVGIRQVWENFPAEVPDTYRNGSYRVAPNVGIGLKLGWGL